ncbi:MAG: single-stranded DNA-binding protein [Lachnospiraceae bacterium]|nr:single-stranded DNA-binding protein [Lachnospiraceae bacterium]
MNLVILIGRLTRDPDIRNGNESMVARYTLAVDRAFKKEGEQNADFIPCVCFGKSADFAQRFLTKGKKIAVEGRIQTGSYEKDGQKVYTTEVIVNRHEFVESKSESTESAPVANTGFVNVPENVMDEMPFG